VKHAQKADADGPGSENSASLKIINLIIKVKETFQTEEENPKEPEEPEEGEVEADNEVLKEKAAYQACLPG